MRELKFRLWDLQRKIFLDNPSRFRRLAIDFNGGVYDGNQDATCLNGYLVQQYIGIKDINGIEIFEGDIVRLNYYDFARHGYFNPVMEVVFDYGSFKLRHPNTQSCIMFENTSEIVVNTVQSARTLVIGNTLENPELLKNA